MYNGITDKFPYNAGANSDGGRKNERSFFLPPPELAPVLAPTELVGTSSRY